MKKKFFRKKPVVEPPKTSGTQKTGTKKFVEQVHAATDTARKKPVESGNQVFEEEATKFGKS